MSKPLVFGGFPYIANHNSLEHRCGSKSKDLELVRVAGNGQQLRLLLDPILQRLVRRVARQDP